MRLALYAQARDLDPAAAYYFTQMKTVSMSLRKWGGRILSLAFCLVVATTSESHAQCPTGWTAMTSPTHYIYPGSTCEYWFDYCQRVTTDPLGNTTIEITIRNVYHLGTCPGVTDQDIILAAVQKCQVLAQDEGVYHNPWCTDFNGFHHYTLTTVVAMGSCWGISWIPTPTGGPAVQYAACGDAMCTKTCTMCLDMNTGNWTNIDCQYSCTGETNGCIPIEQSNGMMLFGSCYLIGCQCQ